VERTSAVTGLKMFCCTPSLVGCHLSSLAHCVVVLQLRFAIKQDQFNDRESQCSSNHVSKFGYAPEWFGTQTA
jgi:hypothetical protein